jgi:hypothetical protein
LVGVQTGFKSDEIRESSSDTSDFSQGEGDFLFSVNVRVEDTEDKFEVFFLFELNTALNFLKSFALPFSTLNIYL